MNINKITVLIMILLSSCLDSRLVVDGIVEKKQGTDVVSNQRFDDSINIVNEKGSAIVEETRSSLPSIYMKDSIQKSKSVINQTK